MAKPLYVGELVRLGWNGGKLFAERGALASRLVKIEAVGHDWVVIRCDGRAYAHGFSPQDLGQSMRELLQE